MYLLVSLLVLETVLEGLLCSGGYAAHTNMRKFVSIWTAGLLVLVTIGLVVGTWQVWAWSIPLVAYRLINILRVYRSRLPSQQLRTVTFRAFWWLLICQVIVTAVAWSASHYHAAHIVFNVLVAAQLLAAIILLRASTHTWQHAGVSAEDTTLTDKELPTLSVLIPARNETDDLEKCLKALVASEYPKLEILAYDDCSANKRTPEIIRAFAHDGVRFIPGDVPDESRWLPKNYAYERLSQEASGEILLFCGVDAVLEPQSLRQLVGLLSTRKKDMLSVMPLRAASPDRGGSLLQAMRYYWEICLPRRFFKRPPVLSTCWLIRSETLAHMGGFESASRSVSPEASFARQAVANDTYSFIRSDENVGVYSNKPSNEQYGTSVRVRYPQLHRRLELVAIVSFFEIAFLIAPLFGLLFAPGLANAMAYAAIWAVSLLCLFTTYALVSVGARLTNPWFGWLLMPVAFILDLAILHTSLWKYEFSTVDWKGRNVCIPVMQVEPHFPIAQKT